MSQNDDPLGHPEQCRPMEYPEMAAHLRQAIMTYGGISKVARETGYSREGLSRALRPSGNMRLNMFMDVTRLVKFHWCFQPKNRHGSQEKEK